MNKFILLPFFLLLFINSKAQDTIISVNHDTIQCTILSIKNGRIEYEQKNKDGSIIGKSMYLSQVVNYNRSAKQKNNSKASKQNILKRLTIDNNRWCLGLNVGESLMPWYFENSQQSSTTPDSFDKLKSGFHINTTAHYMFNESWGVGLEYSFLSSSNNRNMIIPWISLGYEECVTYSQKYQQYINYLGPSALFVQTLDIQKKIKLKESISAGTLFIRKEEQTRFPYINDSGYIEETNNSMMTSNTLAAKLGLSAEYRLFRNISVGVEGDFILCSLKSANYKGKNSNGNNSSIENQNFDKPLNLSRIDYSVVLRYNF